ncbi:cytochrome c oxidase assembly protein COX11, mitochondrial isoform X2 [Mixophyes fleayi]|uniref:cytochrome c oxidase assembly protein COX11, mitochondrial isoform X2 n=1 Tax=Mixophyes fleayi TaxID=3061075 RepID=UPI003F4DE637
MMSLWRSGGRGLWSTRSWTEWRCRGSRGFRGGGSQYDWKTRNKTVLAYVTAAGVGMVGMSYAAVPLYRMYCQATGLGGSAVAGHSSDQIESMEPVKDRVIKVTFNADVHASLHWNFRPQQTEIYLVPGETALAFYKAKNSTSKPVIGISTYNVIPYEAGQYFNKIQVKQRKDMKHYLVCKQHVVVNIWSAFALKSND